MNSIEGYQTPKREAIEFMDMHPIFRLIFFLFGFIDIVFGSLVLLVMLVKGIFLWNYLIVILFSWFGGVSCLKVARISTLKGIGNIVLFGLFIGFTFGVLYIYSMIILLSRS
jgi:hypothetical protein